MSEFTEAVEAGLEGLTAVSPGTCPGCEVCREEWGFDSLAELEAAWERGDCTDEPYFSWRACECCSSPLGGDREPAHAIDSEGEIIHFPVCVDCMLYLANGDEPEIWE